MSSPPRDSLTVGLAQIAPVWLDRDATLAKVVDWIESAADAGCDLVAFGETLVPGYPFWVERTDGARFESELQKRLYGHFLRQAVVVERGDLDAVREAARQRGIHVVLGAVTAPADRGGHSVYCTLVQVSSQGEVLSQHRKLVPTHEERLVWGAGDGHGLRVHPVGPFTVGGLNCWENWMPLARAALHGLGEDLHVAVWPGNRRNTAEITPFIAREGRSYVLSVSGLMRAQDVPDALVAEFPELEACRADMADGGSCLAGPDGHWVIEPAVAVEELLVATLDMGAVRRERQSFDPSGHYARPDVLRLTVDRGRQRPFEDESR